MILPGIMSKTITVFQEWPVPVWVEKGEVQRLGSNCAGVLILNPYLPKDWFIYVGEPWTEEELLYWPPEIQVMAEQLWTEHQGPQPLTDEELQKVGFEAAGWPVNPEKGRTWSRAVVIADRERQAEIKAYHLKRDGDALEMLEGYAHKWEAEKTVRDAITALKKERGEG